MRAVVVLAVFLASCASAPAPITQQVDMPVAVPCVKSAPVQPEFEFDKLAPTASDGAKILALARDWPRGRKYEGELQAVVAGCR